MVDWTRVAVLSVIAGLVVLIGWAIVRAALRTAREVQALKDKLAGEKIKAEILEKSDASVEAAAARGSDSLRNVDGVVVHGDTLPDWLKR